MKKTKLWIVTAVAVLLLSVLAVTVLATGGTARTAQTASTEPYMKIVEKSVSLEDSIYMYLAVESKDTAGNISLLAYNKPQTVYTKENAVKALPVDYVDGNGRSIFFYRDIIASKMTDTVYFVAHTVKDGKDFYSAPQKFSVVEYVSVVNTLTPDPMLKELTQNMLNYGASAQKYFKYHTDFLANDPAYKIRVNGGKMEDGFRWGVFKAGTKVTMTADAPADGMEFSHYEDENGATVGTDPVLTVTASKAQTYKAVYKKSGETVEKNYTVTFQDHDGTVLKTETVKEGTAATAPANPVRNGYIFKNWDVDFSKVQTNLTVTAVYEKITAPAVMVHTSEVKVGVTEITVKISLLNNPGIASLKCNVAYADGLTLQKVAFNPALGPYVTAPEPFKNPQTVSLMSPLENVTYSGEFATLTFKLASPAVQGTVYHFSVTPDPDNIFNSDFDSVTLQVINGQVTIK